MTKYIKPEIDIKYFTDHISTTDLAPVSQLSKIVYAAGSVNSVAIDGAGAQRTTTTDIKDILQFK